MNKSTILQPLDRPTGNRLLSGIPAAALQRSTHCFLFGTTDGEKKTNLPIYFLYIVYIYIYQSLFMYVIHIRICMLYM